MPRRPILVEWRNKEYFGPDNPELIVFQTFENTYAKSEKILFVLQSKYKNVFSCRTQEIVGQLTAAAWTALPAMMESARL